MASFIVKDSNNNVIPGTVTPEAGNTAARFVANSPLAHSKSFSVTLTTEIQDADGQPLAAEFQSSFQTVASPPLAVSSILPADGAVDIAVDSNILVTFNKAVNPSTVTV